MPWVVIDISPHKHFLNTKYLLSYTMSFYVQMVMIWMSSNSSKENKKRTENRLATSTAGVNDARTISISLDICK